MVGSDFVGELGEEEAGEAGGVGVGGGGFLHFDDGLGLVGGEPEGSWGGGFVRWPTFLRRLKVFKLEKIKLSKNLPQLISERLSIVWV